MPLPTYQYSKRTFDTGPGQLNMTDYGRAEQQRLAQAAAAQTQANMLGAQIGFQDRELGSRERMLGQEIGSRERLAQMQDATARYGTDAQRAIAGDYSARAADAARESMLAHQRAMEMRDTSLPYRQWEEDASVRAAENLNRERLARLRGSAIPQDLSAVQGMDVGGVDINALMALSALNPDLAVSAMGIAGEDRARQRQFAEAQRGAVIRTLESRLDRANPAQRRQAEALAIANAGGQDVSGEAQRLIQEIDANPMTLAGAARELPDIAPDLAALSEMMTKYGSAPESGWGNALTRMAFGDEGYTTGVEQSARQSIQSLAEQAASMGYDPASFSQALTQTARRSGMAADRLARMQAIISDAISSATAGANP